MNNRKTKTSTLARFLGGEEGFENIVDNVVGNTGAGILYRDNNEFACDIFGIGIFVLVRVALGKGRDFDTA